VKAATCSTVLAYDRVRAIPLDATQRDVDRLDDAVPAHPNGSQAHREASTPDDVIVAKSLDVSGDPNVRQLEPNWRMAQTA
jgi:hypothetical protein